LNSKNPNNEEMQGNNLNIQSGNFHL